MIFVGWVFFCIWGFELAFIVVWGDFGLVLCGRVLRLVLWWCQGIWLVFGWGLMDGRKGDFG